MSIFNWFQKEQLPNNPSGILERPGFSEDPRNISRAELMTGATPIQWVEKRPQDFKHYWNGQRTQNGSGSCYAFSLALLMEQENFLEEGKRVWYSPRFIYSQASEPLPTRGLFVEKAMKFLKDNGAPLEILLPSNNLTEEQMRDVKDLRDGDRQVALVYKPNGFAYITSWNFDDIVEILEEGKCSSLSVIGTNEGWSNKNGFVVPPQQGETRWYHAITATDYGLINGKKTISFEHAWGNWGFQGLGYGFIQENYIPYMFVYPQYLLSLPNNWRDTAEHITAKPKYQWNRDLFRGLTNDPDIVALQNALKYEGYFPVSVPSTGNFYGLTYRAVMTFQTKYGIEPVSGYVGIKTRTKLNELFK
jgi:hypothetical protein